MVTKTYSQAVGANVRAAVKAAGVPYRTVAATAGISVRHLVRKLNGQHPFEVDELARIGALLSIQPSTWLPAFEEAAA